MVMRSIPIAALMAAAPAPAADVRDPFDGPWEGNCGAGIYCEIQIHRVGRGVYEIVHVIEERGVEVCRTRGTVSRTGHGCLSGRLGSSAADSARLETATELSLTLSGFQGAPCGLSRNIDVRYHWFLDE